MEINTVSQSRKSINPASFLLQVYDETDIFYPYFPLFVYLALGLKIAVVFSPVVEPRTTLLETQIRNILEGSGRVGEGALGGGASRNDIRNVFSR